MIWPCTLFCGVYYLLIKVHRSRVGRGGRVWGRGLVCVCLPTYCHSPAFPWGLKMFWYKWFCEPWTNLCGSGFSLSLAFFWCPLTPFVWWFLWVLVACLWISGFQVLICSQMCKVPSRVWRHYFSEHSDNQHEVYASPLLSTPPPPPPPPPPLPRPCLSHSVHRHLNWGCYSSWNFFGLFTSQSYADWVIVSWDLLCAAVKRLAEGLSSAASSLGSGVFMTLTT